MDSIPDVAFVEFDFVAGEEFAVFLLECHVAMVFALAEDVVAHVFDCGLADGEGTVTVLPVEVEQGGALLLQPEVGAGFELADDDAEGLGAGGEEEEMDGSGSELISTGVQPRSRRMPPI